MRWRVPAAAACLAASLAGLVLVAGPSAASWASCASALGSQSDAPENDFNGDGQPDAVIGEPGRDGGAGAVRIIFGTSAGPLTSPASGANDDLLITQDASGVPSRSEAGDEFGAAVLVGRLDADACTDLAIGAPGENGGAGAVTILFGSGAGLTFAGSRYLTQSSEGVPGASEPGDRFGAVLADVEGFGDVRNGLIVGGPGETVGSARRAGAVWLFRAEPTLAERRWKVLQIDQNSPGVAGTPQSGDQFGSAIAAGRFGPDRGAGLAIGIPGKNKAAGAIAFVDTDDLTRLRHGRTPNIGTYHQNSANIPGTAAAGDRFGAAITRYGGDLVIGAPGDNGGLGSVTRLYHNSTDPILPANGIPPRFFQQGQSGVPGTAQPGDEFGTSLEPIAPGFLAVGAPGDRVPSGVRGGTVAFIDTPAKRQPEPGFLWHQDSPGMEGAAEYGDRFGATLRGQPSHSDSAMFVGVPGEDLTGKKDAGTMHYLRMVSADGFSSMDWSAASPNIAGDPQAGGRWGTSLG